MHGLTPEEMQARVRAFQAFNQGLMKLETDVTIPPAPAVSTAHLAQPLQIDASPYGTVTYLIPAIAGQKVRYAARALPPTLTLDAATGVIRGVAPVAGRYVVDISATGTMGHVSGKLTIVVGPNLVFAAPPMAWNSFWAEADSATDASIRRAADDLVSTGLAAHGWRMIELGDSWQGPRDSNGAITANDRFPNMKALVDYVHSRGLLFGLVDAAGDQSNAGYTGSRGHEKADAAIFASWGIDAIDYQWSVPQQAAIQPGTATDISAPYAAMRAGIDSSGRPMAFEVSTLGMGDATSVVGDPNVRGDVWEQGSTTIDQWKWVTRPDIFYKAYDTEQKLLTAGVDAFPDLGEFLTGRIGYPSQHRCRLSQSEQMTVMTYEAICGARLTLGCDLERLNASRYSHQTVDLLANDEVLAVDQDPSRQPFTMPFNYGGAPSVIVRPLSDGSYAIAILNMNGFATSTTCGWDSLKIPQNELVRDLWRHQDLGVAKTGINVKMRAHSCLLLRIKPSNIPAPAPPPDLGDD